MSGFFTKKSFQPVGILLVLCALRTVQAQSAPEATSTPTPTPTVSFKLPQLPEGGGQAALVRAIQQRVVYPRPALRHLIQGQCQVSFAVAPDGQVRRVKITRGIEPGLDSAVVNAVRKLPQLVPATQFGKPVACILTAPVTFTIGNMPKLGKKPQPAADSTLLYPAVQRMPTYLGEMGYNQLAIDLADAYLRLGGEGGCYIPHNNIGVLLLIGPSGIIYDLQLIEPDEQEQAALSAAYGDAVAQSEGDELSAACKAILVQAGQHLPRLTPAYANGQRVPMRLQVTLLAPEN